jgi:MFS family permease
MVDVKASMISNAQSQTNLDYGSLKDGVLKLINLSKDVRFVWIVPQSFWTGVSIAYFSGNLTEMLQGTLQDESDEDQFYWSSLAMALFGLGEVFGCFFIGVFIDRLGSKFAVLINLLIIVAMSGVSLGFIGVFDFNALAWIMCFLWGFQDSAVNTHTQEILGFEFDDNYTPFSLFNIW